MVGSQQPHLSVCSFAASQQDLVRFAFASLTRQQRCICYSLQILHIVATPHSAAVASVYYSTMHNDMI
jgi:hypothetical protein